MGGVYFAYMGRRNPLTDWAQFFLGGRYPWRNHARQIWWRSLKGFRGSCGSNFSISHWLCWSSLQHSHTTVWACDPHQHTSLVCLSVGCSRSSSRCRLVTVTLSDTINKSTGSAAAAAWPRWPACDEWRSLTRSPSCALYMHWLCDRCSRQLTSLRVFTKSFRDETFTSAAPHINNRV